jgi:Zn-dependent protease
MDPLVPPGPPRFPDDSGPEPLAPEEGAARDDRRRAARRGGIGALAGGLGVLAVKFKALLALLLNLKIVLVAVKLLSVSWTFLLSLWLYVLLFGWRFAVVLVLVLVAHEFGHYAAFRAYGLPARLPVFVPFLGAYTIGKPPDDLEHDAYIALAGPLTGLGLAAVSAVIGNSLHDPFWLAIAAVSGFLNLFNMIPTPPFDGGRIIAAIWPPLWVVGFILFVAAAIVMGVPLIFVLLIGILGLPAVLAAWHGTYVDPRAATMTVAARLRVGMWYLATLFGLMIVMSMAPVMAPHGAAPNP